VDGRALPRVVYLGGVGRSGSTLTERILGQLPGVCPVGELVHMWQRGVGMGERCGCGEAFPACGFWQEVGAAAFDGWDNVDLEHFARLRAAVDRTRFIPLLAIPTMHPSRRRLLDDYVSYYLKLYTAIRQVSGCSVIVDSSKHASLAFCLRSSAELDLRVIHLVRDSRAVAYSWSRKVLRPDTATPSYMATYTASGAAWPWTSQNAAMQLFARSGTPTLRVRYEDLITATEATLARIATFAGLPATVGRLGFLGGDESGRWADLDAAHTASGNPMRFATGRIPIRLDEVWRTAMPTARRRTVTALTLPLLLHYGYSSRVRATPEANRVRR